MRIRSGLPLRLATRPPLEPVVRRVGRVETPVGAAMDQTIPHLDGDPADTGTAGEEPRATTLQPAQAT